MLWAQAWMKGYSQEVLFWRIVWVEGIIQVAHAALLDEEGVVARGELGEPLPGLVLRRTSHELEHPTVDETLLAEIG